MHKFTVALLISTLISSTLVAYPCVELKKFAQFRMRTMLIGVALASAGLSVWKFKRDRDAKVAYLNKVRGFLRAGAIPLEETQYIPALVEILLSEPFDYQDARLASFMLGEMDKKEVLLYLPRLIAAIDPHPKFDVSYARSEFIANLIGRLGPEANIAQARLVWALASINVTSKEDCLYAERYIRALEQIAPLTPESSEKVLEVWKRSAPVITNGMVDRDYKWLWMNTASLLTRPDSPVLEQAFVEMLQDHSPRKVGSSVPIMLKTAAKGSKRIEKLLKESAWARERFRSGLTPREFTLIEESWNTQNP